MTKFVCIAAVSETIDEVVLLRKVKGPAHLIGKINLPGGKIDPEDLSPAHAAARELREESGLDVAPEDLTQIGEYHPDDHSLYVFATRCDIRQAAPQPGEDEPVFTRSIAEVERDIASGSQEYSKDMPEFLGRVQRAFIDRPRKRAPGHAAS